LNIGGKGSTKNVSSISFELKPPQEKAPATTLSSVNINKIRDELTREIAAAKVGFLDAKAKSTKLKTDKVEITLAFAVAKEASGGADIAELLPVGLTVNGKLSSETGNTIKLSFGQ
jgi:Trypsin-co-occurring domain 2